VTFANPKELAMNMLSVSILKNVQLRGLICASTWPNLCIYVA